MTSSAEFGRRGAARPATAAPVRAPASRPTQTQPPPKAAASSGESALGPALQMFFSFNGRLRRRDYWFAYITALVSMFLLIWGETSAQAAAKGNLGLLLLLLPFSLALPFVFVWSILAIQVKRWHDRDKAWFWLFVGFIPLIGWMWLFVELGCLEGTRGDNRFGHSPKLGPAAVFD